MDFTAYENYRFDEYDDFETYLSIPYGEPPKSKKPETIKQYLGCINWILISENISFQYLCDNIINFIDFFKSSSINDKDFIVKVFWSVYYYKNPNKEKKIVKHSKSPIPIPQELKPFWEKGKKTDFFYYLQRYIRSNGSKYSPYTCTSYSASILFVIEIIREDITISNIDSIVYLFGDYGEYEEYGSVGNKTVISALLKYREYLNN